MGREDMGSQTRMQEYASSEKGQVRVKPQFFSEKVIIDEKEFGYDENKPIQLYPTKPEKNLEDINIEDFNKSISLKQQASFKSSSPFTRQTSELSRKAMKASKDVSKKLKKKKKVKYLKKLFPDIFNEFDQKILYPTFQTGRTSKLAKKIKQEISKDGLVGNVSKLKQTVENINCVKKDLLDKVKFKNDQEEVFMQYLMRMGLIQNKQQSSQYADAYIRKIDVQNAKQNRKIFNLKRKEFLNKTLKQLSRQKFQMLKPFEKKKRRKRRKRRRRKPLKTKGERKVNRTSAEILQSLQEQFFSKSFSHQTPVKSPEKKKKETFLVDHGGKSKKFIVVKEKKEMGKMPKVYVGKSKDELKQQAELFIKKCQKQRKNMRKYERKYRKVGRINNKYNRLSQKLSYIKESQFVNKRDVLI